MNATRAWLALAATEAATLCAAATTGIESRDWDALDRAYPRTRKAAAKAARRLRTDAAAGRKHARLETPAANALRQATQALSRARACGWWPASPGSIAAGEAAPAPASAPSAGAGTIGRTLGELAAIEAIYTTIAGIITECTRARGRGTHEPVVRIHPLRADGPMTGAQATVIARIHPPLHHKGVGVASVEALENDCARAMHDANRPETVRIARAVDERKLRYRAVCTQRHIEHTEVETIAASASDAADRAHWNAGHETFSEWYDSDTVSGSFAVRRIEPIGLVIDQEDDALDEPPSGYRAVLDTAGNN